MWTYEVVAVIIAHLFSDTYLHFVVTCLACSAKKVFWKKLAGFVEIITGSLCVFRTSMSIVTE